MSGTNGTSGMNRTSGTSETSETGGMNGQDIRLESRDAITLVARREWTTRVRSKAYRISLAVMVLAVVATSVIFHFVHTGGQSTQTIGLLRQDAPLSAPLEAAGTAAGQHVVTRTVPDQAAGQAQVRGGQLNALVMSAPQGLQVTVNKSLDGTLRGVLGAVAREQALDAQITRLGGDPGQVAEAAGAASVQVSTLQPPKPAHTQHLIVGIVAGFLIYLSLMTCGPMIAQGVVEEKSSRVVELLLATLRPWQLMAGKVLGIGLLGLVQVAVVGGAGVAAGKLTGTLSLSLGGSASAVLWAVAWYLAGFALYANLFAAAGALVSRQEDLAGVQFPLVMPIMASWIIGISVLPGTPDNSLLTVLSMVPLFAPVLMPMRIALGVAPIWQSVTALLLTVALAVLLIRFAARIYRNSVLRSGARVSWREALKAA
ncbi:ABC transporter permease [Kitasatospora sp. NBC_01302]|uniref:ABC transporter permease n=1 Tax=Kitasatospora sp. NBC_01302 TaxID=2903575 RepID=UPI002E0FC01D|nr:ABC transporter permease [Kitasatospora sp. NBC_01302]